MPDDEDYYPPDDGDWQPDENDPYGIEAMFEEFDRDKDGKLCREEYTALWNEWCYGCEEADVREMVDNDLEAFD